MTYNFRKFALLGVAAIVLSAASAAPINNATRPADDVARDAARKPVEMVKFAGVKLGQTVMDMVPGSGYFTRVFSQTVGPKGHVIGFNPGLLLEKFPKAGEAMKALSSEPAYSNVQPFAGDASGVSPTLAPNSSVDVVWTSQNYHDFHAELPAGTAEGYNKAIFRALKPGGYYVILDHSAAAGSGLRDAGTLHRIDAATVKAEVIAAGFKFDGESKLLANAADDRSKIVFDPAVRGKTDQFIFRFVKPKK